MLYPGSVGVLLDPVVEVLDLDSLACCLVADVTGALLGEVRGGFFLIYSPVTDL